MIHNKLQSSCKQQNKSFHGVYWRKIAKGTKGIVNRMANKKFVIHFVMHLRSQSWLHFIVRSVSYILSTCFQTLSLITLIDQPLVNEIVCLS